MLEIGNKAKLVNSKICQRCAKCCKVFDVPFTIDEAIRFKWMDRKEIEAFDLPINFETGEIHDKTQNKTYNAKPFCV